MKQNGKQFVAGFLCGAIIFGASGVLHQRKIELHRSGWINGIWI